VPHIVIVPLSTLRNWERELATWAPQLNVVVLAGNEASRQVGFCFGRGFRGLKGFGGAAA
jgi:SNF2 family DNA or RNA helicase